MTTRSLDISRRGFLESVAAAGAAAAWTGTAGAQAPQGAPAASPRPGSRAPDGPLLKAGLIGCGGRGTGAAANFIDAGPNLTVVALADVFPDRVTAAQQLLNKEKGQDISGSCCYTGFDAYQKLIESDVDVVLNVTPPHFRPIHTKAAVEARKHVFLEKPVSVDVPGALSILATAEKAESLGLSVMTGTQLRRDLGRMELVRRVRDGAIGDITSVRAIRNQGALWYRVPEPGQSEMEAMIRDWVNWTWLSGDIVVEMHIHHLDSMLWALGRTPTRAVGMGGRARRTTGDQYDFFSVDYEYDNGVHMHSTIRQINGCTNERQEVLVGTRGWATMDGAIFDLSGKQLWKYDGPTNNPVVQEHVDWVTAIRTGKPINTAKETVNSTLMAIMGRDSAYTGKAITWKDLLASTARLGPTDYSLGPVGIKPEPPVPGVPNGPPLNAKKTAAP
jgi:predicted dehydrogenase